MTSLPQTAYLQCEEDAAATASYSVITLNYDRILESVCELTRQHPFEEPHALAFDVHPGDPVRSGAPSLVKLHGSIDHETLIPPTWQKTLHPEVKPLWQRAHALLQKAHHLRIIGYSLPPTDGYVPYLLKAGLRHAPNLKSIHVLCLDKGNEAGIEKRYDDLIDFRHYRFHNGDVISYLDSIASRLESGAGLEYGHTSFFGS